MKYKIKYNYDTGDSLNHDYGLENYLEVEFDDLEVAKQNLVRIQKHYQQYKILNDSYNKNNQEILEKNQNEDWFVKVIKPCHWYMDGKTRKYQAIDKSRIEHYKNQGCEIGTFIDSTSAELCIILYTDNGKPFQMSCPWCGYFEKLNSVEIEEDKSDRIITF